jgi:hypothetical protein
VPTEADLNLLGTSAYFHLTRKVRPAAGLPHRACALTGRQSVVLDRIERAQSGDPSLPQRQRVALVGGLALLKPSDYYDEVSVCERCYRVYTRKDAERAHQARAATAPTLARDR